MTKFNIQIAILLKGMTVIFSLLRQHIALLRQLYRNQPLLMDLVHAVGLYKFTFLLCLDWCQSDFLFYKSRTVTQTSPVQSGCRETASQSYQNLQSEAGIDHPSDVIKVCPQW